MASQFQVLYAFVNASATGNTNVVAVQSGQRILVLQCCIITGAANQVKFQSNTSDISAGWPLASNGGFVLPYSELGWFQTNIGEALNFNQSTSVQTAVQVVWCPVNT